MSLMARSNSNGESDEESEVNKMEKKKFKIEEHSTRGKEENN